ncbi:hypothetical protein CDD80_2605 [Ophiocordyceps camponoti-rufipedis]|uniref:Uncharacterized protein n=1 Tax=Ophiocordyceps camponoti-rufipedis TaxID=2004952 RepID=A0A2C5Z6Y9_9HYPO|nr:hypothetical protein CDD80_2605 [Ophiocordyceps camponoti-rufipedis]
MFGRPYESRTSHSRSPASRVSEMVSQAVSVVIVFLSLLAGLSLLAYIGKTQVHRFAQLLYDSRQRRQAPPEPEAGPEPEAEAEAEAVAAAPEAQAATTAATAGEN